MAFHQRPATFYEKVPTSLARCVVLLFIWALLVFATFSVSATAAFAQEIGASDQYGTFLEELGKRASGERGVVAASHPLAAEAGLEMLQQGGTAVDAAVATAFVLGVVEPMMAGIGGGGSMVIWREEMNEAHFVGFYASAGKNPDYGLEELPDSLRSDERMVAIPGTVAGLLSAHERFGTLRREAVIAPAIRIAREGFLVHPLLASVIEGDREKLTDSPAEAELFYPGDEPIQAGERLVRPRLAQTLGRIAEDGRAGFYEGPVAETIIGRLSEGGNPLTLEDFANFEATWRRPLCGVYQGHTVLSAPPPLSGAEVLGILELLEPYDLPTLGLPTGDAEALGLLVDAIRVARADRGAWIGDPDDTGVPAVGLASAAFAEERAALLGGAVPDTLKAGDPWEEDAASSLPAACRALDAFAPTSLPRPEPEDSTEERQSEGEPRETHTTHLSVVDAAGNAVSLTFTMGRFFGSGVMAAGAFLNSAALNFGGPEANRRASYRTPRSTTAPTLVLEEDDVRLVVGSPGSGRIPPAIAEMIVYTLAYEMDPGMAIRMPRVYPHITSNTVQVEQSFSAEALAGLQERGYDLDVHGPLDLYFGGVHMILVQEDGLRIGVADPRRNGAALAQ